jgi:hypothetical protein
MGAIASSSIELYCDRSLASREPTLYTFLSTSYKHFCITASAISDRSTTRRGTKIDMPVCAKCQCEIEKGEQVCPWCGTQQKRFAGYRKWFLPAFSLITLSSIGVILTFPIVWDGLFHLGFRQPLLNLSRLERLLKSGDWEQADRETSALLNQATQANRNLNSQDRAWSQVKRVSCADLQALNQLWLTYSHGRFGFSIQKQIYNATTVYNAKSHPLEPPTIDSSSTGRKGGNSASSRLQSISDDLALEIDKQRAFRDQIGWGWFDSRIGSIAVNDPRIHFNLTAPAGHLPSYGIWLSSSSTILPLFSTDAFAKREEQCGL